MSGVQELELGIHSLSLSIITQDFQWLRVAEFLTSSEERHLSLTEELTLGRDLLPSNEEKSEQYQHRIRLGPNIPGKCLIVDVRTLILSQFVANVNASVECSMRPFVYCGGIIADWEIYPTLRAI